MITKSFIFLPRVSNITERKIWQQDINDWDVFLSKKKIFGFNNSRKEIFDKEILKAKSALKNDDFDFFHSNLAKRDHFRLYNKIKEDSVFLDIETSGFYGDPTVIGLYDGQETKTFVRGINFDRKSFLNELAKYKSVITFNGLCFDIPVLEKYFGFKWNKAHIDLRFVCSRLGYTGGLKNIEKIFNLKRADEVEGLSGEDAVFLWRDWRKTGNRSALDKLIAYNEEDIVNLKPLADKTISMLWEKVNTKF